MIIVPMAPRTVNLGFLIAEAKESRIIDLLPFDSSGPLNKCAKNADTRKQGKVRWKLPLTAKPARLALYLRSRYILVDAKELLSKSFALSIQPAAASCMEEMNLKAGFRTLD